MFFIQRKSDSALTENLAAARTLVPHVVKFGAAEGQAAADVTAHYAQGDAAADLVRGRLLRYGGELVVVVLALGAVWFRFYWLFLALNDWVPLKLLSLQFKLLLQLFIGNDLNLLEFLLQFGVYLDNTWEARIVVLNLLRFNFIVVALFILHLLLNLLLSLLSQLIFIE